MWFTAMWPSSSPANNTELNKVLFDINIVLDSYKAQIIVSYSEIFSSLYFYRGTFLLA